MIFPRIALFLDLREEIAYYANSIYFSVGSLETFISTITVFSSSFHFSYGKFIKYPMKKKIQ